MFTRNKQIEKSINTLYEELQDLPYDTRISWDDMRKMAALPDTASIDTLYYVANRVCLMLMQHNQRYLETQFNFGKRIIKPAEHSIAAKKTIKKSVKIYGRAGAILACTNMDELTEEQKLQVIQDANKYSTLEMFARELLKKKQIGIKGKDDGRTAGLFLDTIKMFTK